MRLLIQRVSEASVTISGAIQSRIGHGLLVLVGIEDTDTETDVDWLATKLVNLRVFDDNLGVMNRSVLDIGGEVLVVSQFTLMASVRKGNRPSYVRASKPKHAMPLYEYFCNAVSRLLHKPIGTGIFGADMQVALVNEGPVTIWMDSHNKE